jgi:glycine cleavage system regulatory protein
MKRILAAFGWVFFGLIMGVGLMRYVATEKALQAHVAETAPRPERTADGRIALYYTAADRAHVSTEMLAFLQGMQTIQAAALQEDRETIAATANALRRGNGQGQAVQMKSPDGFRRIGQSLRQDFGAIADMSDTASMADIQLVLSDAMTKCAACHGSYKAVEVSE